MTTFTWAANTPTADWSNTADWGRLVDQYPVPGYGQTVLIQFGTVGLETAGMYDISIILAQPMSGVTLAATGVDLGDNALLATQAVPGNTKPIVYEVIGTGTLDGANPMTGLAPQPGAIDFSAAPLTIDLAPKARFTNDGAITGGVLDVTTGGQAEFVNDTAIVVTGLLTLAAGVTLDGTGAIALNGIAASANLAGTVAVGQTVEFANMPADGQLRLGVTIDALANFQGSVLLDRENEIVLPGESSGEQSYAGGVLTFVDGATLDVLPAGGASTIVTQVVPGSFGHAGETLVEAACFHAGTRIATAAGEVAVEDVRVGDVVRLAGGGLAAVVWVGGRVVNCGRHPCPDAVWPVRIRAGAVAPGVPARDLLLSPDHAVALAGRLIPARHLANGATITRERAAVARYHHIELARHDLLLAEGLAAESYLDTGNRAAFAGGGPALALHPDFSRRIWAEAACLKLADSGPALARARRALLRRAATLGHRRTLAPGLRVLADGRGLPNHSDLGDWRVRLPPGTRIVRLLSRAWVPAEMRPDATDRRRLGVALGRLWLDGREIGLDSPALATGWHAPEAAGRWTDGRATITVAGARTLRFNLAMLGTYWREPPEAARRRA